MKLIFKNIFLALALIVAITACAPEEVAPWPPRDLIINGEEEPIENTTELYNVALYEGASYTWTIPASATLVSGQGTFKIEVAWGAAGTGGDITVSASGVTVTDASMTIDVVIDE